MLDRIWNLMAYNIGTKIISVIIAIVLWVVVLGSRNVEAIKEIPFEVVTSPEVVVANDIPEKVAFRLAGPKAFLRAILDRREDPIRVNLSGAKPGLVTYRFFSDNIRVPIGVKVLTINPNAILIKLEAVKKREVPVRVELRGIPPEGYRIAKTEVKPETVRIRGAESRVDSMTEVSTLPIDVSSLKQSVERQASLDLTRYGVQIEGELPRVFVDVEAQAANYRIKNVDIRVISSLKSKVDEKTVTVLVNAASKNLKTLDRSQVYAEVDMSGRSKGKYTVPVRVVLPEGVTLVKVIPDLVNVTLYQ